MWLAAGFWIKDSDGGCVIVGVNGGDVLVVQWLFVDDENGGGDKKWSNWVLCGGGSGYCGLEWAGGCVLSILLIE